MDSAARKPTRRQNEIKRLLILDGAASVQELSRSFGVSEATIRRDLTALEENGTIKRSHGGAAVQLMRPAEEILESRERADTQAKRAIARAARALVPPGSTIFLNDGTTIMALARELAASDLEVFAATSALNAACTLVENEKITVCLLGGFLRRTSLATGGPFAETALEQLSADVAFLSFDAFAPSDGGSLRHPENAALARRMVTRARKVVALVTARKFHQPGRIMAVPIDRIDAVVTEQIEDEHAAALRSRGVEVILATDRPRRDDLAARSNRGPP